MEKIINEPFIRKIIKDVLDNHLSTDYAIRYVTVMISKNVRRDPKFFLASEDVRLRLLDSKNYETDFPNVICKTLHELIRDVLKELGINSKIVIATNTVVPLYALIVEGEHNRYFIDALHDLFRVQYNIRPVSYGAHIRSNTSIIDREKEKITDLSLDYIRQMDLDMKIIDGEYFSDFIDRIKNEFIERNKAKILFREEDSFRLFKSKMRYNSDTFLNIYKVEGPIERAALHVYLRNNLFNKTEKANFHVGNRVDKEGNPVFIQIKLGSRIINYEEVKRDNIYSLEEISEVKVPSGIK